MLSLRRPREQMAHSVPLDGEDGCCPAFGGTSRQFSTCSTMLPSSPPTSPPMSRMVSPGSSFDCGECEEVLGGARFDFELSGFHDEMSEVVLPMLKLAEDTHNASTTSRTINMIFLPTLTVLFSFGLLNSVSLRLVMGFVAIAMLLPGLFLYIVDGCRPTDYEKEDNDIVRKGGSHGFLATCLAIGYLCHLGISTLLGATMGAVSVLMVLPGLYLYMVEGCRPEDFEEGEDLSTNKATTSMISLVSLGLVSLYASCVSMAFRMFMGTIAVLMLLPGLYLYLFDGCRPDDYEEHSDSIPKTWHSSALLLLGFLGVDGISGVHPKLFCASLSAVAALMLLPGLYLYTVQGCRPDDYNEDETMAGRSLAFAIVCGLVSLCGIRASTGFCVFMGPVAALMVLPGLYLYMVDGCRPEDVEEERHVSQKKPGSSMLVFVGLGLTSVYGCCASTVFRVFMIAVMALMLLPGFYLYALDGCRPEDYEETADEHHKPGNAFLPWFVRLSAFSFAGLCLSTHCYVLVGAGAVTALMLLPGLYLYVVDGCRPEDFHEDANPHEARGTVCRLSLASLALGYICCLRSSTAFFVFSGVVVGHMLLPGFYLWVVKGCKPEDYVEQDTDDQNKGGIVVSSFLCLVLGSLYGMWTSYVFRAMLVAVVATVFLPGLYLYVVDNCRPEDVEE